MATEPARPEPVLRDGRGHNSERPAYHTHTHTHTHEISQRVWAVSLGIGVSHTARGKCVGAEVWLGLWIWPEPLLQP